MLTLFGFDYISNDYKVFRILYERGGGFVPVVQAYSVTADCFNDFYAPILKNLMVNRLTQMAQTNIVVNGVLYFDGAGELVSFDLHEQVF